MESDNMKLLIKDIKEKRVEYEGKVDIDKIENNGDEIRFYEPIKFNGYLKKGENYVEIEG